MCVGEKIKKHLDENGITQKSLSKRTNISTSKLNLSLKGKRRLTFEEYEVICWALNVNTDFFIQPKQPTIPKAS